jgi:hypothetical protein
VTKPRKSHLAPYALVVVAALAPFAAGCSAIAGDQVAPMSFDVVPRADGTFSSWDELSVDDPTNTSNATLLSVTFDTGDPPVPDDLSYLTTLIGVGVNPDDSTMAAQFCSQDTFPAGEQAVTANVDYHDNIVPFFSNEKIMIQWSGTVNVSAGIPADGYVVHARLQVEPQ